MVLAILNDPTMTDPLAAMVYKRLTDARRLMNKNNERLLLAQHAFGFIKKRACKPGYGHPGLCREGQHLLQNARACLWNEASGDASGGKA